MTEFENYLMSIGFLKCRYCHTKREFIQEKEGKHEISSMTNISYTYVKDLEAFNNWEEVERYEFGLDEVGKPPTLKYPYLFETEPTKQGIYKQLNNDAVNRILAKKTPKELLTYIRAQL